MRKEQVMLSEEQKDAITKRELRLQTSRSGGKGGQNVNKVETRVELTFDVEGSQVLSESQKKILLARQSILTDQRFIKVQESRDRSQFANRELAVRKLFDLINKALKPRKKRVPTKPSKASKQRKLDDKKRRGEIKKNRRGLP